MWLFLLSNKDKVIIGFYLWFVSPTIDIRIYLVYFKINGPTYYQLFLDNSVHFKMYIFEYQILILELLFKYFIFLVYNCILYYVYIYIIIISM